MDIDGVLYLPNFSNKEQQEEFKKVFAYSLNLDKVDNKDWKINIDKCKSGYVVKDREALEALLARVDNGFLDLNHTPLQFLKLKFFGIR